MLCAEKGLVKASVFPRLKRISLKKFTLNLSLVAVVQKKQVLPRSAIKVSLLTFFSKKVG